jgi:hypothetical protein
VYFQHGWDDYYAIAMLQPGWGDRLNAHQVNWMLLSSTTTSLGNAALATGEWAIVYQDAQAVVLKRKRSWAGLGTSRPLLPPLAIG